MFKTTIHLKVTFIKEISQIFIEGWLGCFELISEAERIAPQPQPTPAQAAFLVKLKQKVMSGVLSQNQSLPFTIWPACDQAIEPQWQQHLSCLELVCNPEKTIEALAKLDSIDVVPQLAPETLRLVFKILTARFQNNRFVKSIAVSESDQDDCLITLNTIARSLREGWLLKHWFQLVQTTSGQPLQEENLLLQVQDYHPSLAYRDSLYQKKTRRSTRRSSSGNTADVSG